MEPGLLTYMGTAGDGEDERNCGGLCRKGAKKPGYLPGELWKLFIDKKCAV